MSKMDTITNIVNLQRPNEDKHKYNKNLLDLHQSYLRQHRLLQKIIALGLLACIIKCSFL